MLDDARYRDATADLVRFIGQHLVRDGDHLWRTAEGRAIHTPAFAEDYLAVADGLLGAHAALGDADALLLARRLVETAVAEFWDDAAGTFVDTSDEHDRTVARPRGLVDNATPSANSMGADVLQRLALLTGDAELDRRARSIVRAVAPALERQPSAFGRMLCAADRMRGSQVDVVVAAANSGAADAAHRLRVAASAPYVPDLVLTSVAPGDAHAGWPLYEGKSPGAVATAYACRGYACDAPTDDPDVLRDQVRRLAGPQVDPA